MKIFNIDIDQQWTKTHSEGEKKIREKRNSNKSCHRVIPYSHIPKTRTPEASFS